jgi:hypothetical protein
LFVHLLLALAVEIGFSSGAARCGVVRDVVRDAVRDAARCGVVRCGAVRRERTRRTRRGTGAAWVTKRGSDSHLEHSSLGTRQGNSLLEYSRGSPFAAYAPMEVRDLNCFVAFALETGFSGTIVAV